MSHEAAPILRAFAVGKCKQDARKSRETAEERQKREIFHQECAAKERIWAERVRKQKLKEDEKFARRVARKQSQNSYVEIISWNDFQFPEPVKVHTPQIQGELRVTPHGQNSLQVEKPTPHRSVMPSEEPARLKPQRPKKNKKIDDEAKKILLNHYCYLRRNKRKAPLLNTICYGHQLKTPIFISDSILHSWIHNPKNGVNTSTWRLEEIRSFQTNTSNLG